MQEDKNMTFVEEKERVKSNAGGEEMEQKWELMTYKKKG